MEAVVVAAQVAVVGAVVVLVVVLVLVVGPVAVSRQLPLPACSSSERMRRCR